MNITKEELFAGRFELNDDFEAQNPCNKINTKKLLKY